MKSSFEKQKRPSWFPFGFTMTALIHFHRHIFPLLFLRYIHIIRNDAQSRIVALALGDPLPHLSGLLTHSILFQRSGSNPHKIEYISVLTDQQTVGLLLYLLILPVPTKFDVRIITEPHSAKLFSGLYAPCCQLIYIQLQFRCEWKQQTGTALMPKYGNILKLCSALEDTFLCQKLIDPVLPFLQRTSTALQNKPFLILHLPQLIYGDLPDAHRDGSSIFGAVIPFLSS